MDDLDIDVAQLRQVLESRLVELRAINDVARDSCKPVELDQTCVGRLSRMDAMQMQAMSKETDRRRKIEIQRIKSALNRIDSGDFGYCVTCD
ncbi:MAG: TraR/DksA family transcriptional regulator, partial [Magnetococcales bacterium]|nr:TraR/DksA family transcriptional regulator [Magnetococcales bacterium]